MVWSSVVPESDRWAMGFIRDQRSSCPKHRIQSCHCLPALLEGRLNKSLSHMHVLFFSLIERAKEGREEILPLAYTFCFKSIEDFRFFMLKSLLSDSYSCWLPVASCCFSCTLVEFISSYFFSSTYLLPSIVQVSTTANHLNLATKFALYM